MVKPSASSPIAATVPTISSPMTKGIGGVGTTSRRASVSAWTMIGTPCAARATSSGTSASPWIHSMGSSVSTLSGSRWSARTFQPRVASRSATGQPIPPVAPSTNAVLVDLNVSVMGHHCVRIYSEAGPNSTPKQTPVVVDYRVGTITSFPLGKPVVSSSTTAEIASDSGAMRPIAGTSLPCSAASVMPAMHCGVGLPNTR